MLEKAKQWIEKALKHLDVEYAKLQLWRANPVMVEWILVEQYGSMQPIQNMASVSNLDSQTLSIKPWDRNAIHPIAKAITESWLGLNPQTMADSVLIKVPPLTEEIAKVAKNMAEEAKVSVRNARQESLKDIKKAEDNKEISEDVKKDYETQLQKIIDEANKKIDEKLKLKEADIMKI